MHRLIRRLLTVSLYACLPAVAAMAQDPPAAEPPPASEPAAQEQAPPPPASQPPRQRPDTPAARLADLNEGIVAYLDRNFDLAREIFQGLRAEDPENPVYLYHLGLVYMEDGLSAVRDGDFARAQAAFTQAGECLRSVIAATDSNLTAVDVALRLGIAQLAAESGKRQDPELRARVLAMNREAQRTIEAYLATPAGSKDRLGYFFLGIACYRLGTEENRAANLAKAADQFDQALSLGEADRGAGELDQTGFERFETNILFYQALLDIERDATTSAREKLAVVAERSAGTRLGNNAEGIVKEIDDRQKRDPAATVLPTVVGPLRLDGYVNIGQGFDSNVILLGNDTELPRGIAREYDYRFGIQAGADISRVFTRDDGVIGRNLLVGVGGFTFNSWQPSIPEYDINTYGGRAYFNWEMLAQFRLGLQYDYSYTKLGNAPFISSNRITPVATLVWRGQPDDVDPDGVERATTNFYYSYDYRWYLDELSDDRFDRDGRYWAFGVTQSFNLMRASDIWKSYYEPDESGNPRDGSDADRWLVARVGYEYRNELTQGSEFDLVGNLLTAGVEVPLPWRLIFDFRGDFYWDDYLRQSRLDFQLKERYDHIQRLTFGLTRTLIAPGEVATMPTLNVRARASTEITFQDSNIWDQFGGEPYSFDRGIYGLQLLVNF